MTGLVSVTWVSCGGNANACVGVICRLRRIQSSRYEIGLQMQRNIASETTYTSLVGEPYLSTLAGPADTRACIVDTLFRQHPRAAIRPHRTQGPATERLRRQVATIPIPLGPRGRIRLQPPRRLARPLATTSYRNQKGAIDVRHLGDAAQFRGLRGRLRTGASEGERQVRRVAKGYFESVRCQVGQRDEGDACVDLEGEERARTPFDRGFGRWWVEAVLKETSCLGAVLCTFWLCRSFSFWFSALLGSERPSLACPSSILFVAFFS